MFNNSQQFKVTQSKDKRGPYHFLRTKGRTTSLVVLVTGLGNVDNHFVVNHEELDLPLESEGGDHQVRQVHHKKDWFFLPRESEGDARQAGARFSDGEAIVLLRKYAGLMPCLSRG